MASLKETKQRINSVQGTRKVTSAMKMVASAKLHRAQSLISNMVPYQKKLDMMVANFLGGETKIESPYIKVRRPLRVAVVAFSSNSSLCGAFNYNIIREFTSLMLELQKRGVTQEHIEVYPIGKKVEEAAKKMGFKVITSLEKEEGGAVMKPDFQHLAAKPNYAVIASLARLLMAQYAHKQIDRVVIVYHHFKSAGVQVIERITYLPVDTAQFKNKQTAGVPNERNPQGFLHNYIVEPSVEEIIATLLPQVLIQKLYTCLLDSHASEHAARTMAMQVATDNADDLIQELTIQYNKSRQQSITAELLDIVGGSMK